MVRVVVGIVAAALSLSPAFAHTGIGEANGFAHGFVHPIGGIDHVLAMLAVGVYAAFLGGRALWLVPLSFVLMMAAGGALGIAGIALPSTETAIAVSVVVLGLALALQLSLPAVAAMAFVGVFAIFHGHAHGAEMPDADSGLAYGAGFSVATALLHVLGIGLGLAMGLFGQDRARRVAQIAGGLMTVAGVGLLAGFM